MSYKGWFFPRVWTPDACTTLLALAVASQKWAHHLNNIKLMYLALVKSILDPGRCLCANGIFSLENMEFSLVFTKVHPFSHRQTTVHHWHLRLLLTGATIEDRMIPGAKQVEVWVDQSQISPV